MPPTPQAHALRPQGNNSSPPAPVNIPAIALIVAFTSLLLVCLSLCCCSYRRTALKNQRYERRTVVVGAEREWVGGLPDAPRFKLDTQSLDERGPPAYCTHSPARLASPLPATPEAERLLPPTPLMAACPSPPPPTYNASG